MSAPESDNTRDHDIVIYGATGFVGKLTAQYLELHAELEATVSKAA